jgi:hypothetical protein
MHSMSNLNKFHESYQVLKNNLRFGFLRKKNSRIHKECLNKFFWPKILITNTLGTNVHIMYECDKNQMPYYNIKYFLNENFENFRPFIKHGPHWINFTILTFISEKK